MKNQNQGGATIKINYKPNTMYIVKNEGMVIRNIDGYNVDWIIKDFDFSQRDTKDRDIILSILN